MQAKKRMLCEAIEKTDLHGYKEFFLKNLRPCVSLVPTTPLTEIADSDHPGETVKARGLVPESTLALGASRLGGKPDLPAAFVWPEHAYGPYRFLGQINMRDIRDACTAACADASEDAVKTVFDAWLPPPPPPPLGSAAHAAGKSSVTAKAATGDGLLSFFFAEDPEERTFWRDIDFVRAFYFSLDDPTLARRVPVPSCGFTDAFNEAGCIPVKPVPCWMLPSGQSEFPNHAWPLTKEEDDSYEYQEAIAGEAKTTEEWKAGFLFGFPHYHTLCYDPTPDADALLEPERKRAKSDEAAVADDVAKDPSAVAQLANKQFVPLLNMPSYDELGWCWMDGDRLMTFVDAQDLAQGNFRTVLAEAG